MSLWRQLTRGLRALANGAEADRDTHDELSHYVELSRAERVAHGAQPGEAQREASLEIGNLTAAREELRSHGWESFVATLFGDLQFGLRRLRREPGFAITTILILALGIGASTAIFSAVKPVLFETLPYPAADRLVMLSDQTASGQPLEFAFGNYLEIARRTHSFEHLAPVNNWQPALLDDGRPERLVGQRVGADYFRALGRAPFVGRDFRAEDDLPHGPNVVIISNALWQRRFHGDREVVGKSVRLGDEQYLVIGVMARDFENVLAPLAELWAPLQYNEVFGPQSREWGHHLRVIGRVQPGVSVDAARAELNRIARTAVPEFSRVPWASLGHGVVVSSLQADVTRAIRPVLIAVVIGVLLVLAIVCVNVANLLLARAAQRRGEFAMRSALGAGRTRLARQLVTESVALALLGGLVGMCVAELGVLAIVALSPPGVPRLASIRLDGAVFAFGFVVTTIVGIVVGLLPALSATVQKPHGGTKESSARIVGGNRHTRGMLVVAEVALALVLLVSAGLLFKSIARVLSVRVGFDSSELVTMQVQETGPQFRDDSTRPARADSARVRFYLAALDAVRQQSGVKDAAFVSLLPLNGETDTYGVHLEGDADPADDGAAVRYAVTPEYFGVMGIPLRGGRLLDARDDAGSPRAVVINESFAKRTFAAEPIGKRLRFGPDEGEWYTVVGVVGDVKQSALDSDQPDQIYVTPAQWHWVDGIMSLVVRARGDVAALVPGVRGAIWSVNPDIPISRVATMRQLVDQSVSDRHFALTLFEAFGFSALMLAAIGVYGVLSGSVTERLREFGVRAALGASARSIVGMVLRAGMTLAAAGVVVGVIASLIASRVVTSMLFGISRLDLATYASVVALLAVVSAIACALPAFRASRVDPASTLKAM